MTKEESRTRLENTFPLNTFRGETQRQLVEFVLEEIDEARIDELERVYIAYGTNRNAKFFHIPDGKTPLQPLEERMAQLHRQTNKSSEEKS